MLIAICLTGDVNLLKYTITSLDNELFSKCNNPILFIHIHNDIETLEYIEQLRRKYTIFIKYDKDERITLKHNIGNSFKTGITAFANQLNSLKKCYQLCLEYENQNQLEFNIVIRCRIDVIFKPNTFNPKYIDYIQNLELIVPDFHKWSGINDRFAMGNKSVMGIYMNSIDTLANIYNVPNRNAEFFVKWNLDYYQVKVRELPIHFNRRRKDKILNDV